jgi:hypothetical protein
MMHDPPLPSCPWSPQHLLLPLLLLQLLRPPHSSLPLLQLCSAPQKLAAAHQAWSCSQLQHHHTSELLPRQQQTQLPILSPQALAPALLQLQQ